MISSPDMPMASASISSHSLEQSTPQPQSRSMSMRAGLGVAFTAKYSLKPRFHAKASSTRFAFSRMPLSS